MGALKPRDMKDIDATNFRPRPIDELPHYRFIGGWDGGISHHSDRPTEGPKGIWDNETILRGRHEERAKKKESTRSA